MPLSVLYSRRKSINQSQMTLNLYIGSTFARELPSRFSLQSTNLYIVMMPQPLSLSLGSYSCQRPFYVAGCSLKSTPSSQLLTLVREHSGSLLPGSGTLSLPLSEQLPAWRSSKDSSSTTYLPFLMASVSSVTNTTPSFQWPVFMWSVDIPFYSFYNYFICYHIILIMTAIIY